VNCVGNVDKKILKMILYFVKVCGKINLIYINEGSGFYEITLYERKSD